ncbi:response regulator transcription factor [Streptomyces sp. NBC_01314]|uniref:response regulator transcription factor n=1 Tax=Streptomyces sp. NBC_01314 TaxID=2903821 RepID=UPI003086A92B|nr:response regulator transcription factor [Streptomyces sp. NBC_01314]
MSVIRVLLACENKLLRDAVSGVLAPQQDIRILGAAGGRHLVRRAAEWHPHVVILVPWATAAAAHAVYVLRRVAPRSAVLVLSTRDADRTQFLAAGAHGCLPAQSGQEALLAAVRELSVTRAATPVPQSDITLSPRQREVLGLAAEALSNKQIARILDISIGTVKRHLHVVFQKLGAVSRLDAVARAHSAGLLPVAHGPAASLSKSVDRRILAKT